MAKDIEGGRFVWMGLSHGVDDGGDFVGGHDGFEFDLVYPFESAPFADGWVGPFQGSECAGPGRLEAAVGIMLYGAGAGVDLYWKLEKFSAVS